MNENEAFIPNYGERQLVFERGQKMRLFDSDGREYLDFGAGIAVNIFGHGDTDLVEAIASQAKKLIHTSNLYHSLPTAQLARRLTDLSGFAGVFFCNSGTEANEAALKFSRAFQYRKCANATRPTKVISFENGFHGRTFGSLSATSNPKYREPFEPLVPGFEILPFNDFAAAQNGIDSSVAAVIVEPIQGEGGVRPAKPEFLQALREFTKKAGALLIFDEIQCSLGRLGELFAFQKFGVIPDIVTLAKPLAAGLPMGATLVHAAVKEAILAGDHGSTFGGNAVCAAAALCVLDKIERDSLIEHVRKISLHFAEILGRLVHDFPAVFQETRGMGLLQALETRVPAKDISLAAQEEGLLVLTAGAQILRFAPPLIVGIEELQLFDKRMRSAVQTLQLKKELKS